MIVNGAQEGVAGFGLAGEPNLSALLYDPYATYRLPYLDPRQHDNRTVVSLRSNASPRWPGADLGLGSSNPRIPRRATHRGLHPPVPVPGIHPAHRDRAEHRLGLRRTIPDHSAVAPRRFLARLSRRGCVESTHGNAMGGRTIFPAFTCNGNTCTVTAPPNANVSPPGWHQLFVLDGPTPSHSVFVRIGGDPGKLGSWPNLPGFNPPGE